MTPLRIGYTCHDAFPSTHTNTQQIFWTLSEVARLGHHVDLCVPAVRGGAAARALIGVHYGAPDGAVPDRLRFVPAAASYSGGPLAKAWFDLRAAWRFTRFTHDVVWTRDPLAFAAALQWRVPVVFETYRPDFASSPAFAPWRASTIGHSRRMQLVGGRRMAGVVTHSTLAANAFLAAGVPAERVLVAHNGCAPTLMTPALTRAEARAATGLPDHLPLVMYTGHVGPEKGTDALIALAAAVPEVRLVIVGLDDDSDERRWVEQCARRAGASNLVLVPRVGLRDVARYLYAADCLVIPPTEAPLTRYHHTVLPMKVFSYLAAGRPILAPALPDIQEVLADDDTAVLVPPGNVAAQAAALRSLLAEPGRAARLAASALESSRSFTWSARAEAITARIAEWIA